MADGFANSWVEGEPAHLLASAASPVDTRKPSSSPDEAPRSRRSGAKRAVSVRGRSPRSHRRGRSFQLPDLECCQATHPPGSCACTETRARSRRRGEPIAPPSLSWASPPAHGAHCTHDTHRSAPSSVGILSARTSKDSAFRLSRARRHPVAEAGAEGTVVAAPAIARWRRAWRTVGAGLASGWGCDLGSTPDPSWRSSLS
mmetsp:Transcript_2571/g.10765  ORF Transcript_2571/g.10765 Transcript_2571/m.10765 type:complete len:201 (-) Transcript_2571:1196-1798(-)